jgi:hypothetical protein
MEIASELAIGGNVWVRDGEVIGAMLATHAAGVMMAVNRRQEFESALASRGFIGRQKTSS